MQFDKVEPLFPTLILGYIRLCLSDFPGKLRLCEIGFQTDLSKQRSEAIFFHARQCKFEIGIFKIRMLE